MCLFAYFFSGTVCVRSLYEKWQASCGFMFCQSRDWICREGCSDSLCPKTPLHTLSDLGRTNQEDVGLALNSHFLQSRSRRMLDIVGFVWLKYVWLHSVWCSCVKKFESALRLRIRDIWDTPLATRVFGTPREGVETHWCQSLRKLYQLWRYLNFGNEIYIILLYLCLKIIDIDIKIISNYKNYFVYLCLLIFDQEKCLREY